MSGALSTLDGPFYREVIATVSDGIVALGPAGTIAVANPSVGSLLGYDADEIVGEPIGRLFPDDVPDAFATLRERAGDPDADRHGIVRTLVHETGREVDALLTVAEAEYDGSSYLIVTIADPASGAERDETDARERPDETDSRPASAESDRDGHVTTAQLEALHDASRALYLADTKAEAARVTVDLVQTVIDRPYAAVWEFDPEADVLTPLAATERASTGMIGDGGETDLPSIEPGTVEMELYRRGETRLLDYPSIDRPAHPDLSLAKRLIMPLGEHGLLTVGSISDDIDDSIRYLVGVLAPTTRAAFDNLDAKAAVRRRSAAMESAIDGMAITDGDGEFLYVNDAFAELYGYDDPTDLVGTDWKLLYEADEVARFEREIIPIAVQRGHWYGEAVGKRADGSLFPQEHSMVPFEEGLVCIVRDVSERKARERQLESLNEVARELMNTETREEIVRIGVETVEETLGFEIACARLFDHDANRLECVAKTDAARELVERRTAYDFEASLAGRAFRTDETVINAGTDDDPEAATIFEEPSIHVPIGTEGVLSVLLRPDGGVSDTDVHLVEMLAMGIGAALARAHRTQLLQVHEQELSQHSDQLETLNRINELIREVVTGLVATTTREELDRTVCEHLIASDLYHSAWLARVDGSGDRIAPVAGAGVEDGYLEAMGELSLSRIAGGAVRRAIETSEIAVIRQYRVETRSGHDDEPDERLEATAAVPLLYGDRLLGVLVVDSVREDVFDESALAAFSSLGRTVGFAKNALKNRELLLSDSIVELEFTFSDPSLFYVGVTGELDCHCEFERAVPSENGRVVNYDTITGADPTAVLDVASNSPSIESARVVAERDDGFVLQTVTDRSVAQLSLELGTTVRAAEAEGGVGTLVIEAPQSADVREIVTAFEREFPTLDLVAKRERERSVTTANEFRESVADRLTDKQRAALEAAYLAGYYDWPRRITAEELAESIGVSSSTLHQHLRKGAWCLLSAFLDEQH